MSTQLLQCTRVHATPSPPRFLAICFWAADGPVCMIGFAVLRWARPMVAQCRVLPEVAQLGRKVHVRCLLPARNPISVRPIYRHIGEQGYSSTVRGSCCCNRDQLQLGGRKGQLKGA